MNKLKIGKIVTAVGLKGEVKIYNYAEDKSLFEELPLIRVGKNEHEIEKVRYKGLTPIIKLSGISDRNSADKIIGKDVFMDEEDLPDLPDGIFYVKDIIGFDVIHEEKVIGRLKDVKTDRAQDLYVVKSEEKEIMIPGVKEFIKKIDIDKKEIIVNLPEGLLDI